MYVEESLGSDVDDSALTAAAMPIGGLVGVIASGYISDKLFQARRAPVVDPVAAGDGGDHVARPCADRQSSG